MTEIFLLLLLAPYWLPAALFYGYGIKLLLDAGKNYDGAIVWLSVFALCLSYTLYDGVYLKHRFDERAARFKNPIIFGRPRDDVRTIQTSVQQSVGSLARSQICEINCLRLLFSGRFDKVIIAYQDPLGRDRTLYRTYAIVTQSGCKTWPLNFQADPSLWSWQQAGRCITETQSDSIAGARFLVIESQADDSSSPPWPIYLSSIRLVDGDRSTPIARTESAVNAEFTFPFPVPGFFAHELTNGFPTDWRPGFLFFTYSYGEFILSWKFVGQVFGIAMDQPLPKPDAQ